MGHKTKNTDYIRDQLAIWVWENREKYDFDIELEDLVYIFNYGRENIADRVSRLYRSIKDKTK